MKTLPRNFKLLIEIEKCLNDYLRSPYTAVEIRSNELYDLVSRNSFLKSAFPTGKVFNQFLRQQHQNSNMSSFLCYHVDTTNSNFYQWYFRAKKSDIRNESINTETFEGSYNYYKNSKTSIACDGIKLNSNQEVFIYEQLIQCSHLLIKIEYPITRHGETKYVDFIIQNKLNRKEFFWEHFGMTNNEDYKDKMTEKIEWYRNNGFTTIEKGGNLIYTYYSNDNNLKKDVTRYIEKINIVDNV